MKVYFVRGAIVHTRRQTRQTHSYFVQVKKYTMIVQKEKKERTTKENRLVLQQSKPSDTACCGQVDPERRPKEGGNEGVARGMLS